MAQQNGHKKLVDKNWHTVLVVDDSRAMRLTCRKVLEQAGYRIAEAAGGEEALTVISQCHPDIVLMDYDMPGMDGITACQRLQSLQGKADIPAIMVTAADDADLINAAFDAGAIDYIAKPINWVVLKRRLQCLLSARDSELELKKAEEKYRLITESSLDVICVYNISADRFTFVSPSITELLGYTVGEMRQLSLSALFTSDDYETTVRMIAQKLRNFRNNPAVPARFVTELHLLRQDGTLVWGELSSTYRFNAQQEVEAVVVARNIADRKQAQTELQTSEERYRLIAETMSDVIWVYNTAAGKFTFMTPSVTMVLGYSVNEMLNFSLGDFMTPAAFEQTKRLLAEAYQKFRENPEGIGHLVRELQHVCKDGALVWVESSVSYRYNSQGEMEIVGVSRNIDERKKREEEVQFLSLHDPLTGLLNRNALRGFDVCVHRDWLGTTEQAVVFIDIDNFRVVNDTFGSAAGDRFILDIAGRLKDCVATNGSVYRYGGDEFIAVIESGDSELVRRPSNIAAGN